MFFIFAMDFNMFKIIKHDLVRFWGIVGVTIVSAVVAFFHENDWDSLAYFSFFASSLTIVGLLIAWTELKGNSKIVSQAKEDLLSHQKETESGFLISNIDHIIDFVTKKNLDYAFISFNFIHTRLDYNLGNDQLINEIYKKLSAHRNDKNITNADKNSIIENLVTISNKLKSEKK